MAVIGLEKTIIPFGSLLALPSSNAHIAILGDEHVEEWMVIANNATWGRILNPAVVAIDDV